MSDVTPSIKVDKPLVVYIFIYIVYGEIMTFSGKKCNFEETLQHVVS